MGTQQIPTEEDAEQAVATLLAFISQGHTLDASTLDTPKRVLKAWREDWGVGYRTAPPRLSLFQLDPNRATSPAMVVVSGISFCSTCEHHMAPFYGTATIGYLPTLNEGTPMVVGLSKLARVVDHFARRLQMQERLCSDIAGYLANNLSKDVGVILRATHMCMVTRGVKQPESQTQTIDLRGCFFNDAGARSEFLVHARP